MKTAALAFSLILALPAGAVAVGIPDVQTSPAPWHRTLKQYTFDNGGAPDPQGWTTHDLTVQPGNYWHIDDFAGLGPDYLPLSGTRSMWCGVRAGEVADPAYLNAPGYGNRWMQVLESQVYAVPPLPGQVVTISFMLEHDLYTTANDRLDLEYRWSGVGPGGPWTNLATFTGTNLAGTTPVHDVAAGSPDGDFLQFRFVLSTGHLGSDETDVNTRGAVVLDNIGVSTSLSGSLSFDDFDGGTSTWTAGTGTPFGDFAGLVSGTGVAQSDGPNTTHVWAFFKGSTDTYACGGHPERTAVPHTQRPGSRHVGDYIANEIRSPLIDVAVDENGGLVGPAHSVLTAEVDVYDDIAYPASGISYMFRARFVVGGVIQPWQGTGIPYATGASTWLRVGPDHFGTFTIPAGATHAQIGIIVFDRGYTDPAAGTCHPQSPFFDNVRVSRIYPPLFVRNRDDSGTGSLRAAITSANTSIDLNVVLFQITGVAPHVIQPMTPLPAITQPLWIDGFHQPESAGNTLATLQSNAVHQVMLDGSLLPPGSNGLVINYSSTVRGLAIGNFAGAGIQVNAGTSLVVGCHVGIDPWGYAAPNGIGIQALAATEIGGPLPADRTVISGNTGDGTHLAGSGGFPPRVARLEGSLIGVAADGTTPLPNGGHGVRVLAGFAAVGFGGGGLAPCSPSNPERNKIAFNAGDGVRVDPSARGAQVTNCVITGNGGLGIDLGGDGATPNDPLDADSGANDLLNHPVLAQADATTVQGTMDGAPNAFLRIEFFRSGACGGGGEIYMGFTDVGTDGAGHADFSFSCAVIPPASTITATAYRSNVGTSEFSPCITSTNTPAGSPSVPLYGADNDLVAEVSFSNVTTGGNTTVTPAVSPPDPNPSSWNVGDTPAYWDVTTTAVFTGPVEVCFYYDEALVPAPEGDLKLLHYDGSTWVDVTSSIDTVNDIICGTVSSLSPFVVAIPAAVTGVGGGAAPTAFALHAAVPNPFNPATTIQYDVPAGGAAVEIAVFDVAGRKVRTLVDAPRGAGRFSAQWNGEDDRGVRVSSGVYFYRMKAGTFVETRKMVLLK